MDRIPGPPGYVPDPLFGEKKRLFLAVDQFALEMKARLAKKLDEGYTGWDRDNLLASEDIHLQLLDDAKKTPLAGGKEADIANRAMFLWHRRTRQPVYPPDKDRQLYDEAGNYISSITTRPALGGIVQTSTGRWRVLRVEEREEHVQITVAADARPEL